MRKAENARKASKAKAVKDALKVRPTPMKRSTAHHALLCSCGKGISYERARDEQKRVRVAKRASLAKLGLSQMRAGDKGELLPGAYVLEPGRIDAAVLAAAGVIASSQEPDMQFERFEGKPRKGSKGLVPLKKLKEMAKACRDTGDNRAYRRPDRRHYGMAHGECKPTSATLDFYGKSWSACCTGAGHGSWARKLGTGPEHGT